jgi:tRNA (cytosine38-C5)-methyltransferase
MASEFNKFSQFSILVAASGVPHKIIASVDINQLANTTYQHNHPSVNIMNNNIQSINQSFIDKNPEINAILMSPPCQPFTRNGHFLDTKDPRTEAFLHVIELIKIMPNVRVVLMENVKGFERSNARNIFVETLTSAGFEFKEYILSPTQFGTPNQRFRYYCLAVRADDGCPAVPGEQKIETSLGFPATQPNTISNYLEDMSAEDQSRLLLPDSVLLKHSGVLDICTSTSTNSMCFTKAYSRFIEGTGSVYSPRSELEVRQVFDNIKDESVDKEAKLQLLKSLQLRFFSPREVANLMNFRKDFKFPVCITMKQRYRLLGNSINVSVVAELIKILSI